MISTLSNQQVRVLKYIYKNPKRIHQIHRKFKLDSDSFSFLMADNDFIYYFSYIKDAVYDNSEITINNFGTSYIDEFKRNRFRWLIPTVISVIALISSVVGWFLPLIPSFISP